MSKHLTPLNADNVAYSVKNLYDSLLAHNFPPVDAWEFVLNFYKGAGSS